MCWRRPTSYAAWSATVPALLEAPNRLGFDIEISFVVRRACRPARRRAGSESFDVEHSKAKADPLCLASRLQNGAYVPNSAPQIASIQDFDGLQLSHHNAPSQPSPHSRRPTTDWDAGNSRGIRG